MESLAHCVVVALKTKKWSLTCKTLFLPVTLLYANIIIIRTNFLLIRSVSTCVDHLQVTVQRNDVSVVCYRTCTIFVGDVMRVLGCFACPVGVSLGLSFF
jgi:hypothetical protein